MTAAPRVTLTAQPSYPAGAPVPVKVVLTNASTERMLLNSRLLLSFAAGEGDLAFDIEGAGGQGYEYGAFVTIGELQDRDFTVLPPGGSLEREVDLAADYSLMAPGSYRAAVIYRNARDWSRAGTTAWTGEVRSEPVVIELT